MRRLLAVIGVAIGLALLVQPPARAASTIDIEASIGGRDITSADSTEPIRLDPREPIPLELTIHNTGDQTEEIRHVRLEGKALGLTFLTYDLGVQTRLAPDERTTIETNLDFFDLESQATGYLGTSLRVYDTERHVLAQQRFVVDVRGKATSTLGLFAFVVVAVAIFSCTVLVLNTLRRRLPSNRFVRGMQFAVAGSAVGITLALGVSILRVAFADVEAWAPLVFLPTVLGFALGYIAPGPLSRSIRDVRDEEALQAAAEQAVVARRSGSFEAPGSNAFLIDVRLGGSPPSGGHEPLQPSTEDSTAASAAQPAES